MKPPKPRVYSTLPAHSNLDDTLSICSTAPGGWRLLREQDSHGWIFFLLMKDYSLLIFTSPPPPKKAFQPGGCSNGKATMSMNSSCLRDDAITNGLFMGQ